MGTYAQVGLSFTTDWAKISPALKAVMAVKDGKIGISGTATGATKLGLQKFLDQYKYGTITSWTGNMFTANVTAEGIKNMSALGSVGYMDLPTTIAIPVPVVPPIVTPKPPSGGTTYKPPTVTPGVPTVVTTPTPVLTPEEQAASTQKKTKTVLIITGISLLVIAGVGFLGLKSQQKKG